MIFFELLMYLQVSMASGTFHVVKKREKQNIYEINGGFDEKKIPYNVLRMFKAREMVLLFLNNIWNRKPKN